MAIIKCPECNRDISDKAKTCPNCGFPISEQIEENNIQELIFPDLPIALDIGQQIVNWGGNAGFEGFFEKEENVISEIKTGKVHVLLHADGIKLCGSFFAPLLSIHNRQLISIKQTTGADLVKVDKSVIGRAVVGGLILGPLGSIIGGMSGIGNKEKVKDVSYLILNYWDVFKKTAQTILIRGNPSSISQFIRKWNEVKGENLTIEQRNSYGKLNDNEKKLLDVYKAQGMSEALKLYFQQNNIPTDQTTVSNIGTQAYNHIQNLAQENGVTTKVKPNTGCFIATACYGDYEAREVRLLRKYRDDKLIKSFLGRKFIATYYKLSPSIARKIETNEKLKRRIRKVFLEPIIALISK